MRNIKQAAHRSRGYTCGKSSFRTALTLVELLIVLAIVSVLAAISLPITKDLVQQSRVSESVRTVRSFVEAARAQAMNTGREHGVSFVRKGAGDGQLAGLVTSLELVSGAPDYRGDVEGAKCWLIHSNSYAPQAYRSGGQVGSGEQPPQFAATGFPNAAIFDPAQCPTLLRTLRVYSATDYNPATSPVVSIETGDRLVFNGFSFPIVAFSGCTAFELSTIGVVSNAPETWVKIYFDPRSATGDATVGGLSVVSLSTAPPLPPVGFRRAPFEIERLRMRGGSTKLEMVKGAAVDLYFSGAGPGGTEFSPLSIWDPDQANLAAAPNMLPVVVVFDASGNVSRVLFGARDGAAVVPIQVIPKTTMHFLVGRSDQVRPDLLTLPPALNPEANTEISNITDLDARWVSINPNNGRVTTSVVTGLDGVPASIIEAVSEARRAAVGAREAN